MNYTLFIGPTKANQQTKVIIMLTIFVVAAIVAAVSSAALAIEMGW